MYWECRKIWEDTFELIFHEFQIYATSIANPCVVLFVHVHKMYQNSKTPLPLGPFGLKRQEAIKIELVHLRLSSYCGRQIFWTSTWFQDSRLSAKVKYREVTQGFLPVLAGSVSGSQYRDKRQGHVWSLGPWSGLSPTGMHRSCEQQPAITWYQGRPVRKCPRKLPN